MSNCKIESAASPQPKNSALLDVLWESLEAETPALTGAQRVELDHRLAAYKQDRSAVLPWEQVKAGLFKKQ